MARFKIKGGNVLSGTVIPVGNKNEVLKVMAATILTSEKITLTNVPGITDVKVMSRILKSFGASVRFANKGEKICIQCENVKSHIVDKEEASKLRASNVFLGPVLARFGKVENVFPGGDKIGVREMDAHFKGFQDLGAKVEVVDNKVIKVYYEDFENEIKKDKKVFLYEPSVTATENIIMASALRTGETIIENAACEPHVQNLCKMLVDMGVEIDGIGSNLLKIRGKEKLSGCKHRVGPDHIYIGTMAILGLVTGGEIIIKDVVKEDLQSILYMMSSMGVEYKFIDNDIVFPANQKLKIVDESWSQTKGIYSQPWPSFPTDLMSPMIILATQTEGTTLFFEKLSPGRMFFANYLNGLGANIIMCDPRRIVVNGKSKLKGRKLITPDLRAGMAYVIAALCAEGESVIENIDHIDRGYPKVEEVISKLGGEIVRER